MKLMWGRGGCVRFCHDLEARDTHFVKKEADDVCTHVWRRFVQTEKLVVVVESHRRTHLNQRSEP